MASAADVLKMIKDNDIKFVDLRFTDTRGKEQHTSVPAKVFDSSKFEDGHAFERPRLRWLFDLRLERYSGLRHAADA
jgi:glutamine synthetase